jgi:hypothetical protein
MKYFQKIVFISILFISLYLLLLAPTRAENLSSPSYQIQMGNLNMGAGYPTSNTYKMGLTGGQNAPGLFSSNGYKVMSGFWYIKTIIPFRFTLTNLDIDFGVLIPNNFATKFSILTVSNGGAGGYQVTAQENGLLTSSGGTATIPNTSCDNSCTVSSAQPWVNTANPGFGYNMSGTDIPVDFINSTYYRPFSTSPIVVMSYNKVGRNRTATATYKINILPSQAAGDYSNYLIYIATPTY